MTDNFERYDDIPKHVLAAMSVPQRDYYRTVLDGPKLGHGYITAHRQLEVIMGDTETRRHFASYFFTETQATFESFVKVHYRGEPTTGAYSESTIENRVKKHYPELFTRLRDRLSAMFEMPELARERARFEQLEGAFYADLAGAERLSRGLEGNERIKRLHVDYRLAFANIYDALRSLLLDLVAFGEEQQRKR